MIISNVEGTDLELLRSFAERTFRTAYAQDNNPVRFEQYCKESFSTNKFKNEINHPFSGFWMGWEGDLVVSYLKLNFDQHPPELGSKSTVQVERLYVDPGFQGQGLGEQMLDFAYQKAREAKADWIWLSVWQARPAALRFYERCGYKIFGTETFWLADEAQLDWLVKRLVL